MKYVSAIEKNKSLNQYIVDIVTERRAPVIQLDDGRVKPLIDYIREWAGADFANVLPSGSTAKGTALKGSSDLDIFVSLKAGMSDKLEDNFHSLAQMFSNKKIIFRRQNVSVRVNYHALQIDIVPGKKKPRSRHRHTLFMYREKDQDRIDTNVNAHINHVLDSNRINEIIALKIWRDRNQIPLPSMYLEMYAIQALKGKWSTKKFLARNFLFVLQHMADNFKNTIITDPSNFSNRISDDLLESQKNEVQNAAKKAIAQEFLADVLY